MVNKINELFNAFIEDATKAKEKGNHSAGVRARKTSLEIEKLLKEFRKESISWS